MIAFKHGAEIRHKITVFFRQRSNPTMLCAMCFNLKQCFSFSSFICVSSAFQELRQSVHGYQWQRSYSVQSFYLCSPQHHISRKNTAHFRMWVMVWVKQKPLHQRSLEYLSNKWGAVHLRAWCIFCGVPPDAPGQWGQAEQNAVYVTVPFRGIRVFRRSPANTGKQTQEFAANLCHTSCCERQNHRHSL